MYRLVLFGFAALTLCAADSVETARKEIIAAYQRSMDALNRGDAEAALSIDTDDWTSHVVGQPTRTKQELAPFIRRDIASMKPPADWIVTWKPDYERNGTVSGMQIYDVKVESDRATVLCLVGNTKTETVDGKPRRVWTGSHIRDSWIKTSSGWKRRMHEKLTIDERMVDGRPAKP